MFQEFHFLFYSLRNWVDHYIFAEQDGSSQSRQTRKFAESEDGHFLAWYKLYCHCFGDGWDGLSLQFLSFAAEHNLYGYVKDRLERSEVESIDESEFGGPVQAAVVGNNPSMVRLILDHGIDVNAVGGRFGTAIAAAITFNNSDMVSLLKEYGARVELHSPGSPLHRTLRPHLAVWREDHNPSPRSRAMETFENRARPSASWKEEVIEEYGAWVEVHSSDSPDSPLPYYAPVWRGHRNSFSRARAIKNYENQAPLSASLIEEVIEEDDSESDRNEVSE